MDASPELHFRDLQIKLQAWGLEFLGFGGFGPPLTLDSILLSASRAPVVCWGLRFRHERTREAKQLAGLTKSSNCKLQIAGRLFRVRLASELGWS